MFTRDFYFLYFLQEPDYCAGMYMDPNGFNSVNIFFKFLIYACIFLLFLMKVLMVVVVNLKFPSLPEGIYQ